MFDWLFRNRHTGRITIAQFPNVPLGFFLAAAAADGFFQPAGTVGIAVRWLGAGSLIWWALDELIRGVNPWRRFLGGAVLAAQISRGIAS